MRFYLIDRITEIAPKKYVEGVKLVSMSDDVFNEHFPGYPVFPGSLILEGLAQMSGLFFEYCLRQEGVTDKRAVLTLVNRMKYRHLVIPGDCLHYRADVKAFYEAQVPAGRGCTATDMAKAILYVIEQEYETGQAVPVTGGQEMLK